MAASAKKKTQDTIAVSRPMVLFVLFALAIVAGGMTFNVTTISLPKVIDERLELAEVTALEHAVAVGPVVADDRVARIPRASTKCSAQRRRSKATCPRRREAHRSS